MTSSASTLSIASSYSVCTRSFDRLCGLLQAPDCEFSGQISVLELQDELGRFRVWAGNVGAHRRGRVSLDHKLREAPEILKKAVELLKDLDEVMQETIAIVSHEGRPFDELSWSSDSSVSSLEDGSTVELEDDNSTSELQERFQQISQVITCLYRFSIVIRNPAPQDRLLKCASIDVSHYEHFDIQHTSNKFPKAKNYLADRLGKANSRRRQLIKYHEKHHDKLTRYIDIPQLVDTPSNPQLNRDEAADDKKGFREIIAGDHEEDVQDRSPIIKDPSIIATTINSQTTISTYAQRSNTIEVCSDDGQSQTSYATSVNEDSASKLRVPPPPNPDSAFEENPFECPHCFSIISVRNSRTWMKHVFRDLQPYVCTFRNCHQPDRLFRSRHDWYSHEVEFHRKEWFCNACQQPFSSKELFEGHLRQNHFDLYTETQLPALADRCERALESEQACPLCEEIYLPIRLQRHIAHHMQQLALFVLPRVLEETGDDGESVGAQASEPDGEKTSEGSTASTDLDVVSQDGKEALTELPKDLNEPYSEILEKITTGNQTSAQATSVLKWILYATRPLSSKELIEAISVNPMTSTLDTDGISIPKILDICQNLVVFDEQEEVFRFVNVSAQEFLLRRLGPEECHTSIAEVCLTVLTHHHASLQEPSLMNYSIHNWAVHVRSSGIGSKTITKLLVEFLKPCPSYEKWVSRISEVEDLVPETSNTLPPLIVACYYQLSGIFEFLLETGFDPNSYNKNGCTPLHLAGKIGNEYAVQLLADKGADLNRKDNDGRTPLSWAAEKGHEKVVQMLLEKGVDVDTKSSVGLTPLSWAAWGGHEKVVQMLLEEGVDADTKSNNGRTPLLWAAGKGHEKVVQMLLEKGVDVESKDEMYGQTPLSWAAEYGHEKVVQMLLEKGVDADTKSNDGRTPLSWAAAGKGHEKVVQMLLEKGVDVDTKSNGGRTPQLWAAVRGHEKVMQMLLEKGVDVDTKSNDGRTPLLWAAENGHEKVAQMLEKGVDVDSSDSNDCRTSQP